MQARSSLLFTNTRAQAELWHQALAAVWPEELDTLALHHGSLDPALRQQVGDGLRAGALRCVVATSSLDLGVDFPEVEQVLQLGSPKGVARLRQRAGRARHRPGASGAILCVPSHALELAEYAAVRRALAEGVVEARRPPTLSLDVLAQHAVSRALAGGFDSTALLEQVRRTHAFASLGNDQWQAVLTFIVQGGQALAQYPDFHKVVRDADGWYRMHDRRRALRHRLSIGTISSDGSVRVQFLRGGSLGAVEEQFASRLRRGDRFQFAGRLLELVQLRDMTAFVRLARGRGDGVVPRWQGGQLPLSMPLGRELEWVLSGADNSAESRWLSPLLALQQQLSALPGPDHLLVEQVRRREGQFLFVYPFAGRHVHEALAALLALRCTRLQRNSIGYAVNDHGPVLAPARAIDLDAAQWRALFTPDQLLDDLRAAVNLGELARRQFRGIARVAGLLVPSLPGGMPRSLRQLQASAGLLFDVLREHDPGHLLLALAEREVLHDSLDLPGLRQVLARIGTQALSVQCPASLTPLGFRCGPNACVGSSATRTGVPACNARPSSWSAAMADELLLLRAGESLVLLGERALYWPTRQALLIADLHLGKADVFRRAGIALPSGGTGKTSIACRRCWTGMHAASCGSGRHPAWTGASRRVVPAMVGMARTQRGAGRACPARKSRPPPAARPATGTDPR